MRANVPPRLEAGRYMGEPRDGFYGAFQVTGPCGETLRIVASAAAPHDPLSQGWEHVSVSTRRRVPNWTEMCFVKDLFWHEEEAVVQFHPPKSRYVNNHPYCLHLWRHRSIAFPMPPAEMVGVAGMTPEEARASAAGLCLVRP